MDTVENALFRAKTLPPAIIYNHASVKTRLVTHVLDVQRQIQTDQYDVMRLFTNFLETKYSQHQTDMRSFQKMVSCGMPKIPGYANTELDQPITMEEL